MIRPVDACDESQLVAILDESLSPAEQRRVASHLDRCGVCRRRLEELTAPPRWWADTRTQLLACSDTEGDFEYAADPRSEEIEDREHWIVDLLDAAEDDAAIGQLGGLPIHGVVGQGGMAIVLRGHDPQLDRPVAVKILSPMVAGGGAARQRFLREAQAAAAIVHPNVVAIHAVSTQGKLPYIVMPFVAGGSLQDRLDAEGPLPLEQVLSVGLQVAEGLAAAHRQGIIHRDIKPANLLLEAGGLRVLLTDFGLARVLDDVALTASGMVAGTPQYMSPEQARGGSIDVRTDIYSLGAVLYTLACGRPPVQGESVLDVIRRIDRDSVRPAAEINESLPAWFDRLLQRLMARRVDDRVESAEAAAELLRACLAYVRSPQRSRLPIGLRLPRLKGFAWSVGMIAVCLIGWQAAAALNADLSGEFNAIQQQAAQVNGAEGLSDGVATRPAPEPQRPVSIPPEVDADAIDRRLNNIGGMIHTLRRELEQP